MNHKILSGLTAATLLVTTLGLVPFSQITQQPAVADETSEADVPTTASLSQEASVLTPTDVPNSEAVAPEQVAVKVGEYQSQETRVDNAAIASIYAHEQDGRQAATVYVRNIPVLTFLDSSSVDSPGQSAASNPAANSSGAEQSGVKVASVQSQHETSTSSGSQNPQIAHAAAKADGSAEVSVNPSDPVWRATTIAARLNQLYRDNFNATELTAAWDGDRQRYEIRAGNEELVEIGDSAILPDTTNNPAEDVLQATNRLRRQISNAPPVDTISGDPRTRVSRISFGSIQMAFSGMASWYGPGFNGNRSASGEVFNQEALTAAHPSLPFGTQVRVTNMDTGLSVVVRINDRGPYSHGRVIDLSAGAARVIGLMSSGVAPVSLQVLGVATASNR
ncbi:septal ring lytic transglycosylase RlpA family protein [Leptolyngbya ohadii]|uniref:septal ring lytic transglycosylase RlpA family protein n=1 Tax=Leptolyngbya ohadii TaxID=1962290 RepID=UPI000B599B31|nr:septal ring lytic transglycosylase RlpA family protein [Leptolyngbya ohadii]